MAPDETGQDSEPDDIDWETCSVDGCIGIRLASAKDSTGANLYGLAHNPFCWAHASEKDLEAALRQLGQHGKLDARGVTFPSGLLERVLAVAPHDDKGYKVLNVAHFSRATFRGEAMFDRASFPQGAWFTVATFHGTAWFTESSFHDDASFSGATFHQNARFAAASFHRAWFSSAAFHQDAWFDGVSFHRDAWFDGARFDGEAQFHRAAFEGSARFSRASFRQDASFDRVDVRGVAFFSRTDFCRDVSFHRARLSDATFDRAVVRGDAWFRHTVFEGVKELGSMRVERGLVLDNAVFHERVQIEVSAAALCARRARFPLGAHLRVRWAEIALDDADLANTAILSGEPSPFTELEEGRWAAALERLRRIQGIYGPPGRPRLISLQRADVAGLTVASVDLRACRFIGAHNLDQLRIQECHHAFPPEGGHRFRRHTIAEEHHWRARHGSRSGELKRSLMTAIAEEHHWRARRRGRALIAGRWRTAWRRRRSREGDGWYGQADRPPQWLGEVDPPTATQVAAVYRDLRKGREDAKDEPGAAYFYYGEMEMRRQATSRDSDQSDNRPGVSPAGETLILILYWLLSGYGVRARRALVGLAAAILVASVAFTFWGFADPGGPEVRAVGLNDEGAPVYELYDPERPVGLDELPNAIRFSAQSVAALVRGPEPDIPLTATGEWLHLALRLIGPLLFGLAILAIRGRVKR